jgi:integrase
VKRGDDAALVILSAKLGAEISLTKPWARVRLEADLPMGLGLHGLRHSIGSHAAMAGMSAAEIQAVLGHRDYRTSQKYVHFAEQARSTAAERAAAITEGGHVRQAGVKRPEP